MSLEFLINHWYYLFPIFLLLLFCVLLPKSGWHKLRKIYPDKTGFCGPWTYLNDSKPTLGWRFDLFYCWPVQIGHTSYKNVLVGVSSTGLHLRILFYGMTSPIDRPICIPWSAIIHTRSRSAEAYVQETFPKLLNTIIVPVVKAEATMFGAPKFLSSKVLEITLKEGIVINLAESSIRGSEKYLPQN